MNDDIKKSLSPVDDHQMAEIGAALNGPILNIHRMLAHSPTLLSRSAPLRNYLVKESALTDRQREILILRTAFRLNSEYEWAHHVVRGRAAGLTADEIEQTKVNRGPNSERYPTWSDDEGSLLALVDEMIDDYKLSQYTTEALLKNVGNAGLLDAIFTVGFYLTLGTVLKTFDVPLDDAIRPL